MKLSFFQNVDFFQFGRNQLMGSIKKGYEKVISDTFNFDLKISENEKLFLNFADF